MSNGVVINSGSKTSLFNKIPWTFLLIIYLVVTWVMNIKLDGVPGYILIGIGVFVLFAEFFKSGDISVVVFLVDVVTSVIGLIIGTALICYIFWKTDETPNFFHWFGYAILLGDTILSPFNAFRTALRNFGVGSM